VDGFSVLQSYNTKVFAKFLDISPTANPPQVNLNLPFDRLSKDLLDPFSFQIRPFVQDLFAEVSGRLHSEKIAISTLIPKPTCRACQLTVGS
jgi:hypothetical protein